MKNELVHLRALKVEHEAKIGFMNERTLSLSQEVSAKFEKIGGLEQKTQTQAETIEKKDFKIKDLEQSVNALRLIKEADVAVIQGLEIEKKHLELSLEENKLLKQQYFDKGEEIQSKYSTLFKEISDI